MGFHLKKEVVKTPTIILINPVYVCVCVCVCVYIYNGVMLKRNLYLNTLLFADDKVIIQDKLQKSFCILNQISKDYKPQNIYGQN